MQFAAICSMQFLAPALLYCTILLVYCTSASGSVPCSITTTTKDLGSRRCQNASMSEPNHRVRPRALVAPLTLVAAVVTLAPIAAGAHLLGQGGSAPSTARVVASDTRIARAHPKPVLKASAPSAVYQ